MPRIARVVAVDTAHHITQRGNARRTVFETDSDRLAYLSLVQQYARLHRLSILGYCLMPNHVHLIAVPEREDSMARALHLAHGRYSTYLNARQQRTGHVWQNRYFSCPMDDRHLWCALRYVERNPVRAGLAGIPQDYPWSSASLHCRNGSGDAFLDLVPFRARWSSADWQAYIADDSASEAEADRIRRATHTGRPLGSALFLLELEKALDRPLLPSRGGRPARCAPATALFE